MKTENPNQKIEIEFANQKIKSENENQIFAALFTYTHTSTLNRPSSWQKNMLPSMTKLHHMLYQ